MDAPIVGATKMHHIDGAVNAFNVKLTDDDMKYLEGAYVPHSLEGVMADNQPAMRDEPVWVAAARKSIRICGQKLPNTLYNILIGRSAHTHWPNVF